MATEEMLRIDRAMLRGILDAATDESIWVFDREGTILLANPVALQRLGRSEEEVIGRSTALLLPPGVREARMARIRRVMDTGEPLQFEDERDGIKFHHSLCPVRDDAGCVAWVASFSRDITAQKAAEEALRFSEEKYAKAFANSPAAIAMTTLEDGVILDVNDTWTTLTGFSREEAVGNSARKMNIWASAESVRWFIRELEENGSFWDREVEFLKKSGKPFIAQMSAQVLTVRGEKVVFSTLVDITDRKRTEEELRKAHDELEARVVERTALLESTIRDLHEKEHLLLQQSRMAAMGEMISNIAHQWRQPLNALGLIIQKLSLLQDRGLLNTATLDDSVDQSMSLIQHMSGTIDDFRNFFRPNKEKVSFQVHDVVSAAIQLIAGAFNSHQIEIEMEHQEDSQIYGYPSEYAQVVLNILSNAKDAFQARQITDPQVVVKVGSLNGRSLLSIRDNAGGISEEILSKVFDPHFTTKGTHGTGIGLFMSKNIIEKNMNGKISVRNTGDGAEFMIEV